MTGFSDPADPDNIDPADEPTAAPMTLDEPRPPDQDDEAGAPRLMSADDDFISGQYGPTADFGDG